MERHEGTTAPPGLVLRCGHESSRQPATPRASTTHMACSSQYPPQTMPEMPAFDATLVVAEEDPELLLGADARGRARGRRDALLEQRHVGRVRRVLDDEGIRAVHRLRSRVLV